MHRYLRVVSVVTFAIALALTPAIDVLGSGSAPTLRLLSVMHQATITRFKGEPTLYFPAGIYLATTGGAFEMDAHGTSGHLDDWQVARSGDTVTRLRHLPSDPATTFAEGLAAFTTVQLLDADGKVITTSTAPFCPNNGWPVRVNAAGPDTPTFPFFCGGDLTRGAVWGIDRGWATQAISSFADGTEPDGDYTLKISIADRYVRALEIDPHKASATMSVTITTFSPKPCRYAPCPVGTDTTRSSMSTPRVPHPVAGTPPAIDPNANGLPDLIALPAHDLSTETTVDGNDQLDFGATIWNAGSGPLVVEGFRHTDTPSMPATQFVYVHGKRVNALPAGSFEYDARPGHEHWHYFGIASYDLLDAQHHRLLVSLKRSFCLAPTDAINLTIRGAEWLPDRFGLGSSCGGAEAVWLREVLPAGWGDTYVQTVPGQAFDITNLPNGTYALRISVDPTHQVAESRYANNISIVDLKLGGEPGARTVTPL